jgi:hypothetical protein
MSNWLVPYARMFNRYVSSPLLGVIDLYLMLGSLLGICLVPLLLKHPNIWYNKGTPCSEMGEVLLIIFFLILSTFDFI